MPEVTTITPTNTPTPIGPYSHVARVGQFIAIGGTAGVDPATGALAGDDVEAQTRQIIDNLKVMLESADSDLDHVVHVNVFLKDMADFEAMNGTYVERSPPRANRDRGSRAAQARRAAHHEPDGRNASLIRTRRSRPQDCHRAPARRFSGPLVRRWLRK
jgi:2-iminobutanoate/2-iminopropanoate deaminase